MKKQPSFGGALKRADWIQRSVHHDPRPDLPFTDDAPYKAADRYVALGCVAVAVGCMILARVLRS